MVHKKYETTTQKKPNFFQKQLKMEYSAKWSQNGIIYVKRQKLRLKLKSVPLLLLLTILCDKETKF